MYEPSKMLCLQDGRHLLAAEGWIELGNHVEASAELEQVSPEFQAHPAVLQVRYDICAKAGNWEVAAEIALQLTTLIPKEAGNWISLAYATRRKPGGGIPEAKKILLKAQHMFSSEPTLVYNLACYECQLDRITEAKELLQRAIKLGGSKFRQMALEDKDLEPLWKEIGSLGG